MASPGVIGNKTLFGVTLCERIEITKGALFLQNNAIASYASCMMLHYDYSLLMLRSYKA
jgi:hypothetical protein